MKVYRVTFEDTTNDNSKFCKFMKIEHKSIEIKPYGEFFSIKQAFDIMLEFGYRVIKVVNELGNDITNKIFNEEMEMIDSCDKNLKKLKKILS